MRGDLTGESLILKLLRKILQLEATFSLIEDTEYSFKGVIIIVGRRDLPIFLGIRTEDAECNLRGDIIVFLLVVILIFLIK